MKNINFKKSKYVLPLIIFPFLFLFFYVLQSWGANSKSQVNKGKVDTASLARTDQINTQIPGVSSDVAKEDIKDRFQSLREAYKNDKDYSALSNLEGDRKTGSGYSSAYSSEDIDSIKTNEKLDDLRNSLNSNKANLDRQMQKMLSRQNQNSSYDLGDEDQERRKAEQYLAMQQHQSAVHKSRDKQPDEMTIFREQMRLVDSMQKASAYVASNQSTSKKEKDYNNVVKEVDPSKDTSFKPLPVSTVPQRATGFNTVRAFAPSESIKAIIDQAEKVYAGTRLRIRLLQEIVVGNNTIPEGTYVYGFVTGFQTQRVNVTVNQIMFEGQPLFVKLDVFDNDGYLGLYVPQSNFTEFSKQLGTQGTSGLSSVEMSNGSANVASSLISKLFTTTESSVNKMIRKDKAFIKYNYIIYLKENSK